MASGYRLSPAAAADFEAIGRYTQDRWGQDQRRAYLADFVAAFERLADDPHLGRSRDDVRPGLFSYLCGSHVIFFRRRDGVPEIVRILHGRQSLDRAFVWS